MKSAASNDTGIGSEPTYDADLTWLYVINDRNLEETASLYAASTNPGKAAILSTAAYARFPYLLMTGDTASADWLWEQSTDHSRNQYLHQCYIAVGRIKQNLAGSAYYQGKIEWSEAKKGIIPTSQKDTFFRAVKTGDVSAIDTELSRIASYAKADELEALVCGAFRSSMQTPQTAVLEYFWHKAKKEYPEYFAQQVTNEKHFHYYHETPTRDHIPTLEFLLAHGMSKASFVEHLLPVSLRNNQMEVFDWIFTKVGAGALGPIPPESLKKLFIDCLQTNKIEQAANLFHSMDHAQRRENILAYGTFNTSHVAAREWVWNVAVEMGIEKEVVSQDDSQLFRTYAGHKSPECVTWLWEKTNEEQHLAMLRSLEGNERSFSAFATNSNEMRDWLKGTGFLSGEMIGKDNYCLWRTAFNNRHHGSEGVKWLYANTSMDKHKEMHAAMQKELGSTMTLSRYQQVVNQCLGLPTAQVSGVEQKSTLTRTDRGR